MIKNNNYIKLHILEKDLGYTFNNKKLLYLALTHSSACKDHNERLEFLGDSTINYCVVAYLYKNFLNLNEGKMSRMRSYIVKKETLFKISRTLKLYKYLILGAGEIKNGGYHRESIGANTVEAIIGAILIDSNIYVVEKIVMILFKKYINNSLLNKFQIDFKTELQEYLQKKNQLLPVYKIVKIKGKMHKLHFAVKCLIKKYPEMHVFGQGKNIKSAEQASAKHALEQLRLLKN